MIVYLVWTNKRLPLIGFSGPYHHLDEQETEMWTEFLNNGEEDENLYWFEDEVGMDLLGIRLPLSHSNIPTSSSFCNFVTALNEIGAVC